MTLNFSFSNKIFFKLKQLASRYSVETWIIWISTILAILATMYSFANGWIIAYGDAESHLNIAKRVVGSITPGLAQLGGIWLPLPHLLLAPFVYFDFLWRTGLAGSIVSGVSFVVSALFLYKLTYLIIKNKPAAFLAAMVFVLNPNVLYLQTTPMTELPLIVFFILSSYYFVKFIYDKDDFNSFLLAAFYGFCASLSRYDGWFLVIIEAGILGLLYLPYRLELKNIWQVKKLTDFSKVIIDRSIETGKSMKKMIAELDGRIIIFCTLAFFGVALWLAWDGLILGDPLYFTHSEFSAKSQQLGWQAKGQLPAINDLVVSFMYYLATSLSNIGILVFFIAVIGLVAFIFNKNNKFRFLVSLLLATPFVFYVVTLYLGQSIIFIPHLTPPNFEWTLFNVRYGVMMVPVAALFLAYLFYRVKTAGKVLILFLFLFQFALYGVGYSKVISLDDGINGLSTAKRPDAERWLRENYDGGLILLDDFSRLISIVRSGIPMEEVIYIGNKPYWEESLIEPEKYATWIVIQQNDVIWKTIFEPEIMQGRLYKYFTKVYTSPEILIFRKTIDLPQNLGDN